MMVYVTESFEAYHKWEDAPNDVKFLRNLHRHVFMVKLMIEEDRGREIEAIKLKWMLRHYIREKFEMREIGSCEDVANDIKEYFSVLYPNRQIIVEVSEDGENGVIV